ncbi:MAG: ribonuclease III [Eubacteriales bacterium]|nr:ribonuclease III [Eubacteriales bacterium]
MSVLEDRLGHRFRDRKLLETALTHPSFGGDHHVPHYQRLEFLGDAVLELAVSRYLYYELPEVDEGKLTRIRAALVREESLNRAAQRIGLGEFIRLSVGEERSGGRQKPSILSDVMEAVLAAVYLDAGFDEAVRIIGMVLGEELRPEVLKDHLDAKSRLQELMQREGRMPSYDYLSMEGPPHAPVFSYRVMDGEQELGRGSGTSKQNAQQAAARDALKRMGA